MASQVSSKDAPTNPRGIPFAPFVDKVEDYVSSRAEVDGTMRSFQEMIACAIHLPIFPPSNPLI
ncbi:peptide chain release factor 1 [Xylographa opegraphella]|nr:peptide chain release factor 1 [Xylographa opegraphella]